MIVGAFLLWFLDATWASIPRSANPMRSAVPIRFSQISQRDKWIYSYDIYAVFLDKVDSKRVYLLITLVNKPSVIPAEFPNVPSRFVLKDMINNSSEYVFYINPSQADNTKSRIYTVLLDFKGSITNSRPIPLSTDFELSSRDLNIQ